MVGTRYTIDPLVQTHPRADLCAALSQINPIGVFLFATKWPIDYPTF